MFGEYFSRVSKKLLLPFQLLITSPIQLPLQGGTCKGLPRAFDFLGNVHIQVWEYHLLVPPQRGPCITFSSSNNTSNMYHSLDTAVSAPTKWFYSTSITFIVIVCRNYQDNRFSINLPMVISKSKKKIQIIVTDNFRRFAWLKVFSLAMQQQQEW